jgi:hypothetical protein
MVVALCTIASMNTSLPWVALDESGAPLPGQCVHLDGLAPVESSPPPECVDCMREGSTWVNLRQCLTCGDVRCCDNSPRKHASAHWRSSAHPVIRSAQPDELWAWCYPEELFLTPAEAV